MVLNIIIGFLIPWIFCIMLYLKDKKVILTIAPFTSALCYLINTWGFYMNFWKVHPFQYHIYSSVTFNMGLYPVLGSYLVYLIQKKRMNPYLLILIVTIFTTILEGLAFLFGLVIYTNGWNIIYTFISYLIPYSLCYWFYTQLKKINILN